MTVPSNTLPSLLISVSSATTTELLPAVPGRRYKVWQFEFQNKHATTDTDITFKSATTAISPAFTVYHQTAYGRGASDVAWFVTAPGEALNLTTSAAGTLVGIIYYNIES